MERVLSVLWAIIQAKNLGRAKLRLSRGWRVLPGSDGVYRPDRSFTPVRIHRLQVHNMISES